MNRQHFEQCKRKVQQNVKNRKIFNGCRHESACFIFALSATFVVAVEVRFIGGPK
jgi:hypothetical protein